MGWFQLALAVALAALSIWQSKEARKYIDELSEVQKLYLEEISKPKPDDNVVDRLEFRGKIAMQSMAMEMGKKA